MIVFQTTSWKLDLSNLPITFNEKSNYFSDKQSKSFSFPFEIKLTEDNAAKLGMLTVDNVTNYNKKIYGTLVLDTLFYSAYLAINNKVGNKIEVTLFYGQETMQVYDTKLKALPFSKTFAPTGLRDFAKAQITKSWPEASHNFPMIFRDEIKNKSGYEYFNFFLNHFYNNNGTFEFKDNFIQDIDGEDVVFNRNVMVPCTYVLEVLKVAFASEQRTIAGDFVDDDISKAMVLVPQNYMEQFAQSQFVNYSFSFFSTQEIKDERVLNVYTRLHTPLQEGGYTLNIRLNFSKVQAQYFYFSVTQGNTVLFSATSTNRDVVIEKTLDINIVDTNVFEDIKVELKLPYQEASIDNFNAIKFEFNEGRLNVFPDIYNIANYLPDMSFRDFTNKLKTMLNLKFTDTGSVVYIDYLNNELERLSYKDHTHLQHPEPPIGFNQSNLFKLQYPTGEELLVNKTGQIYSDRDYTDAETKTIKIEALPLKIKERYGIVTGIYPDDATDIMIMLYNGPTANLPLGTDVLNTKSITLQNIYDRLWKNWLRFRANSEVYKDSFYLSIHDNLKITQGSYRYNKLHVLKSIERTRVNEQWWKVDVESETL